jgi:hypothetical protein
MRFLVRILKGKSDILIAEAFGKISFIDLNSIVNESAVVIKGP